MIRWTRALVRLVTTWRTVAGADAPLDTLLDPGFIAIDVETTGLDPRRDALVAIAAIPFVAGRAREGFSTLVNPGRPIPATATAVHGIADADVAHAPAVASAVVQFDAFCAGRVLAGHDVRFDIAMLTAARRTLGLPPSSPIAVDTRPLARAIDPHAHETPLEAVAARLGLSTAGRHTADGDARMAGEILIALLPAIRARGARTLADLSLLQRGAARIG